MESLRDLLEQSVEKFGNERAFRLKEAPEKYKDITFKEMYRDVQDLGEALIQRQIGNNKTAIIGKNSYAWFIAYAAVQVSGGVCVPLDKELKYEELESSLSRSGVKTVFCDAKEEELIDRAIASGKTQIEHKFALNKCDSDDIFDLIKEGRKYREDGDTSIEEVEIDERAVSILLFTSGTTSQSKIVMLTQRNVYADIYNTLEHVSFYPSDVNIALLPYHHTFGSTGQWLMVAAGASTVYCDGLKYIQKNLQEYKVTVFVGVPLIIEAMYKKIIKTAEKEGMMGRLKVASKATRAMRKVHVNVGNTLFKGVRDALGGAMRLVVMGAAAADPVVIKGFDDFGIACIQGYGLTETAPVLSAERLNFRKLGSIGKAIPGVEIKIFEPDENGIGEIIARGANVMKGYYKNKEATDEVIKNGWFHTGDLGYFDKKGFLFITGRKKNVIVLKNGKNVFPEEMEIQISGFPYTLENIIVGLPNEGDDKDPVVSLKLVYDPEAFEGKTKEEIEATVKADIDALNEKVPPYKRIKRIFVTDEPMIKTSTSKVKRFKEIEKMLAEEEEMKK